MEVNISEDGFLNMLRTLQGGAVADELDREMSKGICGILDHSGTSEITLKIKMKRVGSMEGAMEITHDVVAKHPKEARSTDARFLSKGNGLLNQPQEQATLDLEESSKSSPNLSSVDNVSHLSSGDK